MVKTDALVHLKDIHLPEVIGWWPLAPGWYAIMFLILLLLFALFSFFYKRHLYARAKKQALILLQKYKKDYERDHDAQLASARISELLKQVALVYYPRKEVASLHGEEWICFLNQTSRRTHFSPLKTMLLESPFKTTETANLSPLFKASKQWIKQRGTPCLN